MSSSASATRRTSLHSRLRLRCLRLLAPSFIPAAFGLPRLWLPTLSGQPRSGFGRPERLSHFPLFSLSDVQELHRRLWLPPPFLSPTPFHLVTNQRVTTGWSPASTPRLAPAPLRPPLHGQLQLRSGLCSALAPALPSSRAGLPSSGLPMLASSALGFHGHGLWKVPHRSPDFLHRLSAPARDSFKKPPASAPFRVGLGIIRVGLGITRIGLGLLLAKEDPHNRGSTLSALASPWMGPTSATAPAHEYCLGRPHSGLRFGSVSASATASGLPRNSSSASSQAPSHFCLCRPRPQLLTSERSPASASAPSLHRPRASMPASASASASRCSRDLCFSPYFSFFISTAVTFPLSSSLGCELFVPSLRLQSFPGSLPHLFSSLSALPSDASGGSLLWLEHHLGRSRFDLHSSFSPTQMALPWLQAFELPLLRLMESTSVPWLHASALSLQSPASATLWTCSRALSSGFQTPLDFLPRRPWQQLRLDHSSGLPSASATAPAPPWPQASMPVSALPPSASALAFCS